MKYNQFGDEPRSKIHAADNLLATQVHQYKSLEIGKFLIFSNTGLPAVIVVISLSANYKGYSTSEV